MAMVAEVIMMSQTTTTITNILGEQLQEQEDNSTANSKDTQWVINCFFERELTVAREN